MRTFALLLLALVAGCSGCASVPSQDQLKDLTLRLEFEDGICSGTKVGPNAIRSASHCFGHGALKLVNGQPVTVLSIDDDHRDHALVKVAGVVFTHWAKIGPLPKQGDRVRWWGNPMGEPDVYREGYVSRVRDDVLLIDATICHGDSGAGIFNDRGELVGVVSAMTDQSGCTYMVMGR